MKKLSLILLILSLTACAHNSKNGLLTLPDAPTCKNDTFLPVNFITTIYYSLDETSAKNLANNIENMKSCIDIQDMWIQQTIKLNKRLKWKLYYLN